jgi:hypothetical protein
LLPGEVAEDREALKTADLHPRDEDLSPGTPIWRSAPRSSADRKGWVLQG